MSTDHGGIRELLGAYVLGHLDAAESALVRAHLAGCSTCRAEAEEIAPLAGLLGRVDLGALDQDAVEPPADLADRVWRAVRAERAGRGGRGRPRLLVGAVAAAVLAVAVGGGVLAGRASVDAPPQIPREQIALAADATTTITLTDAYLVNHTWGVELRFAGSGFVAGEEYAAYFRRSDGIEVPAGEFLGVGANAMQCNLQSAVLRPDVAEVVLKDDRGAVVAAAELAAV